MNFNENQAIYLQIANIVCDRILSGVWKANERIPSVRELAVELQVNPNTVMRAYEHLQQEQVLYNRRGIGHHVTENSIDLIIHSRKQHYFDHELPHLFHNLRLLGINPETLKNKYEQHIQNLSKNENQ
jgi:DNA-binding transcriptional regulator YhcF (GntR family)